MLKVSACAKLNHPSSILYVGSSTTGVMSRIKQHKGDGHKYKSTSALHLSHWAEDRKIKVEIMEYDVPRKIIQLIEDAISTELKPAFGKLGGNNK
jgi:Uri superfamily endonuclease